MEVLSAQEYEQSLVVYNLQDRLAMSNRAATGTRAVSRSRSWAEAEAEMRGWRG